MTISTRRAHAKVNLWLKVVGRRSDGYHLLDSLVAFVDLADTLQVRPADRLSLELGGPYASLLADDPDNLVLKAARLLADRAGAAPLAAITLDKHIPVAAGLGGGSADAAAALRALADLWCVTLTDEDLFDLARPLGADVPMCLASQTSFASGAGERLEPAPKLPAAAILLVNPGVALATRDVFTHRLGPFSQSLPARRAWRDLPELAADLALRGNDLSEAAIALCPVIEDVLVALRGSSGVRYAGMSGSGATCFALYDAVADAERAALNLPAWWWRHAGHLI